MNNTTLSLSLCVHNTSAQKLISHSCKSGISLSSFFEHKYSPNTTIEIIPIVWIIHQSQVDGNPPYIVHVTMCIKKSVTEKSRHFLDFSTLIASNTALLNDGWMSVLYGRCDVIICNIHSRAQTITYPIKLDIRTAALSIHPYALHTSKYLVVNIRSIVILVANKTWLIWKIIPRTR
jgi:hypothetical protein